MTAVYRPPSGTITSAADPTGATDASPQLARELGRLRPGGTLRLAPGLYRLDSPLAVPDRTALVGPWHAGFSFGPQGGLDDPTTCGAVLINNWATAATGPTDPPFLTLGNFATLAGIAIYDAVLGLNSTSTRRPFQVGTRYGPPSAGYLGVDGPQVRRVGLLNADQGVAMLGAVRWTLEDLYISALTTGVFVDQCQDTARLERVSVAPYPYLGGNGAGQAAIDYCLANTVGYRFGRCDGLQMSNCMVVFGAVGVACVPTALATNPAAAWLTAVNTCIDLCAVGVDLQAGAVQGVQFSGGSITNHNPPDGSAGIGVRVGAGAADAAFANLTIGSETGQEVRIAGGSTSFTGVTFYSVGGAPSGASPSIALTGGDVIVAAGKFKDARPQIANNGAGRATMQAITNGGINVAGAVTTSGSV